MKQIGISLDFNFKSIKLIIYYLIIIFIFFGCDNSLSCDDFNELLVDKQIVKSYSIYSASLNNVPENPSNDENLNVSVSGTGIEEYQYKIVPQSNACTGGGYNDTWTPVSTAITDAIGIDGDYKLCIIGRDSDGYIQSKEVASTYTWSKGVWELEVTTTAINQNMTIGFDNPVDVYIDWGDDIDEITNLTSITHTYSTAGVYTLKIRGKASRIHFYNDDAGERLTAILSRVRGIEGITSFENTFRSCNNLTSIPSGLFDNNTQVTNFNFTFMWCTELTAIPSGLFDKNVMVTDFISTFNFCSNLMSIPAGLFDHNTQVKNFNSTFFSCSSLTSIPSGLFDKNTEVISFSQTFAMSGVNSIPGGLFDYNTNVESFRYTFMSSNITSIPEGLFDENGQVTTFENTFSTCFFLETIPTNLFANNALVDNFTSTFKNCSNVTSTVPIIWINHSTASHENCFFGVTNAYNYDDIDNDWKGL